MIAKRRATPLGSAVHGLPPVGATEVPGTEVVVLDCEPGAFLFGQWKNVTILLWAAQATAPTIARLGAVIAKVAGRYPGGRSAISAIAPGLPLPTPEARAAIVDVMNRNSRDLACLAVVVQGSGFSSSALLSVNTEIRSKSPLSYEMGLLTSVDDLMNWLPPRHLQRTGIELDPDALGHAVRRSFETIGASG